MSEKFESAEFMDGMNARTNANREQYCKHGCKFRKKHKCGKYRGRIVNAPCDPIAEIMKQKGAGK